MNYLKSWGYTCLEKFIIIQYLQIIDQLKSSKSLNPGHPDSDKKDLK